MTTSPDILDLVFAALTRTPETTAAGSRVHRPGDLPTQDQEYPVIKLRLVGEARGSLGKGEVQFTTTATVRVIGEVSAPCEIGNVDVSSIEADLWTLKRQIELAIINSYPLFREIQELPSVQTQLAFSSAQATHLAGIQSDYAFEFYEGPEDFAPIAADDLAELHADVTGSVAGGFTLDLQR